MVARLFLAVCFSLMVLIGQAYPFGANFLMGLPTEPGCTTPLGGTFFDGFEGGAPENEGWVFNQAGGTAALADCPTGGDAGNCTACVKANYYGYASYTVDADHSAMTFKQWFYINSCPNSSSMTLLSGFDGSGNLVFKFAIGWADGNGLYPYCGIPSPESYGSFSVIQLQTWHLIECKITKGATSYCRMDGAQEVYFTAGNYNLRTVKVGGDSSWPSNEFFIDQIRWTYDANYF